MNKKVAIVAVVIVIVATLCAFFALRSCSNEPDLQEQSIEQDVTPSASSSNTGKSGAGGGGTSTGGGSGGGEEDDFTIADAGSNLITGVEPR